MLNMIKNGPAALGVSIAVSGCASTDLEFGTPLVPVLTQEEFLAAGGYNTYEVLGQIEFDSDGFPGNPAGRRQQIIYYMTQDVKRDHPQAEALWLIFYHDYGNIAMGRGSAVRRK